MALHAGTVGILIEKSKFEPTTALGVAEAIELAMTQAQYVTVPILDARFQVSESRVNARFQAFESKTDVRIAAFEAKIDARFQAFESKVDARFQAFESKMDARFQVLEGKLEATAKELRAEFNAKLAEMEAKLVRWVFLVMLGNVALSLAANTVLNAFRS